MLQIINNQSLKLLNTLAVDVSAEYFCRVESVEQLQEAISYARQHQLLITVLGGGSNLVLARNLPGLVVQMAIPGITLDAEVGSDRLIGVGAGENWHQLVEYSLTNGWFGLENLALIPGLAGAAPIQNIGAYGVELSDVFTSLQALNLQSGELITMDAADCQFGYRDSIFKNQYRDQYAITRLQLKLSTEPELKLDYPVLQAALEDVGSITPQLVAEKVCEVRRSKLPDPVETPNAGSFFKNPVVTAKQAETIRKQHPGLVSYAQPGGDEKLAAGWLIDQCGWKGCQRGAVAVHDKQALVLVNLGGNGEDILALAADISASVKARYGVTLEIEPRVFQ